MNWKRLIAREWLYILAFAFGGALIAGGIHLIWVPDQVEYFSFRPNFDRPDNYTTELAAIRDSADAPAWAHYISSSLRDSFVRNLVAEIANVDSTSASKMQVLKRARSTYDALYESARENYHRLWSKNRELRQLKKAMMLFALVLPYPLFILFRTIRWSITQVRSSRLVDRG